MAVGRVVLIKFKDDDTDEVEYSDVACRLLDCTTGACQHYRQRRDYVPWDCISLTIDNIGEMYRQTAPTSACTTGNHYQAGIYYPLKMPPRRKPWCAKKYPAWQDAVSLKQKYLSLSKNNGVIHWIHANSAWLCKALLVINKLMGE